MKNVLQNVYFSWTIQFIIHKKAYRTLPDIVANLILSEKKKNLEAYFEKKYAYTIRWYRF